MGAAGEEPLLEIGRIEKAHGLSGEVVVSLVTNVPGRLEAGARLIGSLPGAAGSTTGGRDRQLEVVSSRPFQRRHLVRFEGVASRDAAEALRGVVLRARAAADPEAMFVHELVGCEVVDQSGVSHGRVVAVEANPASDLLVGEDGWLVPLRFVVERREGRIVVDGPEGLFE